jgi:hypothetical protein
VTYGLFGNLKGGIAVAVSNSEFIYQKAMLISCNVIAVFGVDLYERWVLRLRYIKGGGKLEDLYQTVIGQCSECWLTDHFEEDECDDDELLVFRC